MNDNTIITPCKLCDSCGFLNDSQRGVLREDMGLLEIIENQTLFPCHIVLQGFNKSIGIDSENTNTHAMVEETNELKVCSGLIQSLMKSNIPPKHMYMAQLMIDIDKIDPRIMTIDETLRYHSYDSSCITGAY